MDIGEFEIISQISSQVTVPKGFTGIGDDCAIIPQESGMSTLISTDMLIEGTHFLFDSITAYQLGWKSLAVNLSDIAAMGGKPLSSFLSLGLNDKINSAWVSEFIRGYNDLSKIYNCPLLGGDTTKSNSQVCINVTILGTCVAGREIKRLGSKDGDLICVTGSLGDSAAGLKLILDSTQESYFTDKHYFPIPRVREGQILAETAGVHSMMDISDGIGSDLRHILKASNKSAIVDCKSIPISPQLKNLCKEKGWDALDFALNGGEDYELLFTMSADSNPSIPYYTIGQVVNDNNNDIIWQGTDKDYTGFRHF